MKISGFLSENSPFLEVTFSIYLKRRVFVLENLYEKKGKSHCLGLFSRDQPVCPRKFLGFVSVLIALSGRSS